MSAYSLTVQSKVLIVSTVIRCLVKVGLFHVLCALFTHNIQTLHLSYFISICLLCLLICNTIHYYISMRSHGRLVIAPNDIFQQNMCMSGYIKLKWFHNSIHAILQDITCLVAKATYFDIPTPSLSCTFG